MTSKENQQLMKLQVTDGLTVAVLQHQAHEFIMPTKDVALGYGVSAGTIRMTQLRHADELIEGKHFIKGVTFCDTPTKGVAKRNTFSGIQPQAVYWTKSGVVRLGFFIKSERAKMFRDWAEGVILQAIAPELPKNLPTINKRKHNRLTTARLLDIMADVCQIENSELRNRIASKLKGGVL